MEIVQAVILGIVQGLTEFLPISSSGHLVLVQTIFDYQSTGLVFEVFVHFGTVLSVIVVFRRDIAEMVGALFRGILQPARWRDLWETDEQFKLNWLVLIGIIPAGVIGLLVEHVIDRAFQNPLLVGGMLLITALILWSSRFTRQNTDAQLQVGTSIVMGFAQALAIIPGISRSGSTITAGLWLRIHPETAAKFSFFLAIPVIVGASALEFLNVLHTRLSSVELWGVIFGTIAAFFSGWIAILFLMETLRKGKFSWFALYCTVIGGLTIGVTMLS